MGLSLIAVHCYVPLAGLKRHKSHFKKQLLIFRGSLTVFEQTSKTVLNFWCWPQTGLSELSSDIRIKLKELLGSAG